MGATMARHDQDRQTWKLTGGKDIDGDELDVVIATDPIRVVSVF